MFYHEPTTVIIQIENALLGQLIYYWIYYGQPCTLIQKKAKTEGLCAVIVKIDNPDTASFVFILVERLKVKLYDSNKNPIDIKNIM